MKDMIKPSNMTLIISICVILLLIYMIYVAITTDSKSIRITFIIFILLMMYIPLFKMPISIRSNEDEIKINHIIGTTTYLKKNFDISKISKSDLGGVIRLFASGGFGGNIGWFKSSKIGSYYGLYLNENNLLLLTDKKSGKKYIIDNP